MVGSPFTGGSSVGLELREVVTHFMRLDLFMVECVSKVCGLFRFVKKLTNRMFALHSSPSSD